MTAVSERLPLTLRAYRLLTALAGPLAPALISHRLKHGKEHAARVDERYGESKIARPPGPDRFDGDVGGDLSQFPVRPRRVDPVGPRVELAVGQALSPAGQGHAAGGEPRLALHLAVDQLRPKGGSIKAN